MARNNLFVRTLRLFSVLLLSGCASGALQRTGFETLQTIKQQNCQKQGATHCAQREQYEDYQEKRNRTTTPDR